MWQLQISDEVDVDAEGCVSGHLVLQKLEAEGVDFERLFEY